jgi:hypothetical protein
MGLNSRYHRCWEMQLIKWYITVRTEVGIKVTMSSTLILPLSQGPGRIVTNY